MLPIAHVLAAAFSGAAMMPPEALAARVEAFAGAQAMVDPRLILPDCTVPQLAWAGPRSVSVRCAAPVWQVFVSIQGESERPSMVQARESGGPPLVRRGDRVVVELGGEGFLVAVEGVAEADARDGRVMVRAGNKRLAGVIDADGHVRLR